MDIDADAVLAVAITRELFQGDCREERANLATTPRCSAS
jgi:hypothetical protein